MGTIRLDRLTKVYDDGAIAVDGVDLIIRDREFFVILGPSGCGKTSLLRMIAGLEQMSAGDVTVDDRSMRGVPTKARNLAMLFQQTAVYPHLSVRDNIGFPLKLARRPRGEIDQRVTEVAATVGLSDMLDARPSHLSGGMRQRVAMARALVREPTLLLMDEPMSNLDAKLRTELRASLAGLHRCSGATTVYVTHDQIEAMALGDRAAVMRAGRVVQCASPAELYHRPADLFVATFVGAPTLNVARARLVREQDELVVDFGHDRISVGTGDRWSGIDRWIGRELAVGVRPEALALAPEGAAGDLRVEITGVEYLGVHRLALATLEAHAVADHGEIVVDPGATTTIGILLDEDVDIDLWRPVPIVADASRLHLFDLRTGAALPTTLAG